MYTIIDGEVCKNICHKTLMMVTFYLACEQALRAKKKGKEGKESLPASLRNLNATPKEPR